MLWLGHDWGKWRDNLRLSALHKELSTSTQEIKWHGCCLMLALIIERHQCKDAGRLDFYVWLHLVACLSWISFLTAAANGQYAECRKRLCWTQGLRTGSGWAKLFSWQFAEGWFAGCVRSTPMAAVVLCGQLKRWNVFFFSGPNSFGAANTMVTWQQFPSCKTCVFFNPVYWYGLCLGQQILGVCLSYHHAPITWAMYGSL